MERKIGEIFEYNGEWYQCVNYGFSCADCDINGDCSDACVGSCSSCLRKDGKQVRFKKLEKVGEPYEYFIQGMGIIMVQEYILANANYILEYSQGVVVMDCQNGKVAIQIKQTKEDMEEKKLHLKPFDIQKAREGKPVCTRDGRKARIICFDRIDSTGCNLSIVALIQCEGTEVLQLYRDDGKRDAEADLDLMMLPEKKEGWVNVYKDSIYKTKEEAFNRRDKEKYLMTIKVEWEE